MNSTSRPVLYLLPGLLCDQSVWEHQRAALAGYCQVRIPSFPGCRSFREMALGVLREAPERFSVVGHSMGGRVALELMHLVPERIDGFGVFSTGVHPVRAGEREKRMELVRLAEAQGMEALAAAWIPPMVHPARLGDTRLLEQIRQMVLRSTPEDHRNQIEAALTRADQSLYLPAIKHKVLLVCGVDDLWSPLAQHQEIQRGLASSELHVIPDAGHMVTMEQPAAVSRVLVNWYKAAL